MISPKFWKRFFAAYSVLLLIAAVLSAGHAFMLRWLPTRIWYSGDSDSSFILTDLEFELITGTFLGIMFGAVFVCAVDAVLAARLDLRSWPRRLLSASLGTIVFWPFGRLGFAPVVGSEAQAWAVIMSFHITAVVLFYCTLTVLSWLDQRWWGLWESPIRNSEQS